MENTKQQAAALEFRRMIKWIVVAGVLMVSLRPAVVRS